MILWFKFRGCRSLVRPVESRKNYVKLFLNLPVIFDKPCKRYKDRDAATNIRGIRVEIKIIAAIFQWILKQQVNLSFFCKTDIGKVRFNGSTGPRRKIEDRYEFGLKASLEFRVQTEIIAVLFRLNFQATSKFVIASVRLILTKVGLTNLPDCNGKMKSGKKIICYWYQRYKGGNRDYCSHFSAIFKKQVNLKLFL